ncbi:hypothetical protein SLS56_008507 [Neofusicoccum ribis]|uniref:ATPase AAA-type core domain-containing protein n=1 Tax=Neofusicoccum ribis TaxID=45134 RepID=A0ABR3SJW3_9PEZI
MTVKAIIKALMSRPDPIPTLYAKTFAQRGFGPQQSVRQIFTKARQAAPCLLLFEDVDSLVKEEVRSYFLNEIDGLENNDGILMIGSTNNREFNIRVRPSRFDRKYRFKTPSLEERVRYCDWWRSKFADNPDLQTDATVSERVAELTEGFSFASLLTLLYDTSATGVTLEKQIGILKAEMADVEKSDSTDDKKEKAEDK